MQKITGDHSVWGVGLVPGSYFISHFIEQYSKQIEVIDRFSLSDVVFHKPLMDQEHMMGLECVIDSKSMVVKVTSQAETYFSGQLNSDTELHEVDSYAFDKLLEWEQSQPYYAELLKAGNSFLGFFQSISGVFFTDSGMDYVLDSQTDGVIPRVAMLLDGCFHAALLYAYKKDPNSYDPMVLSSIQFLDVYGSLNNLKRCYLKEKFISDEHLGVDVIGVDDSGQVILKIKGLRFSKARRFFANQRTMGFYGNSTLEPIDSSFQSVAESLNINAQVTYHSYTNWEYFFAKPDTTNDLNCLILQPEDFFKQHLLRENRQFDTRFLPNGIEINELNRYETDYVYNEIFVDRCYLRHGIEIHDNDTVIDIGANIGLFALFAQNQAKGVRTISFEPSPVVAKILRANLTNRGNCEVIQKGVSSVDAQADFTFYPKSSVFSGFHTDNNDEDNITAIVAKIVSKLGIEDASYKRELTQALTQQRFEKSSYPCELNSLSSYLRSSDIKEIGLLKVDAERSELDILAGIDAADYSIIRQIVMEVHETEDGELKQIVSQLEKRNFKVFVDKEEDLSDSSLYTLTALNQSLKRTASSISTKPVRYDHESYRQFFNRVKKFDALATNPLCLVLAPSLDSELDKETEALQHRLSEDLSEFDNISLINSQRFQLCYSGFDSLANHRPDEAMMPYSDEWYATVGFSAVRYLVSLNKKPLKVIVLDADNTLWDGVCAESGALGVDINQYFQNWHQFLLEKKNQGVLLCLASKNEEHDVFAVLDSNKDCLLSREDFVDYAINWERKSANIHAIAERLELGLDSFVFVDDNPIECEEVKLHCPEISVIQFSETKIIDNTMFLQNWALDTFWATAEDKLRTQRYQESTRRIQSKKSSLPFAEFIQGLQLLIDVTVPAETSLKRIHQLFLRTNQFNSNKTEYSMQELESYLHETNATLLQVEVKDKFGDYGLVGAAQLSWQDKTLSIGNIVLSCRVLGRGVEFYFAKKIAEYAQVNSLERVNLAWIKTDRNTPILDFLRNTIPDFNANDGRGELSIESKDWLNLDFYDILDSSENADMAIKHDEKREPSNFHHTSSVFPLQKINLLGGEISTSNLIDKLSDQMNGLLTADIAIPEHVNEIEESIFLIFNQNAHGRRFEMEDDLFTKGGTSLLLVNILGKVYQEHNVKIELAEAYANASIKKMARLVEGKVENKASSPELSLAVGQLNPLDLQKGIFFSSLLNPLTYDFNVPLRIKFKAQSDLDTDHLNAALRQLMLENFLLRARFEQKGKNTIANINPEPDFMFEEVQLSLLLSDRLESYISQYASTPFSLQKGPLLRCSLIRHGDHNFTLLLVFHHIVVDLVSLENIYQQLSQLLASQLNNNPVSISNRPDEPSDFVLCDFTEQRFDYWCSNLSDLELLNVPTKEENYKRSLEGKGMSLSLSEDLSKRINMAASQYRVSKNVFLLAIYFDYLFKYYHHNKVGIGVPVLLHEIQNSVANCTNLVPIYMSNEQQDLAQLIEQVKMRLLEVIEYRHIPYFEIVRRLSTGQTKSRSPIIQTTMLVQELESVPEMAYALSDRLSSPNLDFAGMPANIIGTLQQCAQVDISLEFLSLSDSLVLNVKYDHHIISGDVAEKYANDFLFHLERLVN